MKTTPYAASIVALAGIVLLCQPVLAQSSATPGGPTAASPQSTRKAGEKQTEQYLNAPDAKTGTGGTAGGASKSDLYGNGGAGGSGGLLYGNGGAGGNTKKSDIIGNGGDSGDGRTKR
jgi:hypothetical protein